MASRGIFISLVLAVFGMLYTGALAQSSCNNVISSMASCLNYVTGNSSTPSSACCSQLANVVQSSPQCLCTLLNNSGPAIGITINQTLALSLPGACKVQTPPINQCKAATAPTSSAAAPTPTESAATPVGSPASSPAATSNETPDPAAVTPSASSVPSTSSGSGTGSKTVPATTDGSSDGIVVKAPLMFTFFVLLCGSAAAVF